MNYDGLEVRQSSDSISGSYGGHNWAPLTEASMTRGLISQAH